MTCDIGVAVDPTNLTTNITCLLNKVPPVHYA